MKMGRERAVLRWDIRAAMLHERIEHTERALTSFGPNPAPRERDHHARLVRELADLRTQLAALGPSPRAKMG